MGQQYFPPGGGATIPSTTNILKGNGSGNGADSLIVPSNVSLLSTLPADFATASSASPAEGTFAQINLSSGDIDSASGFMTFRTNPQGYNYFIGGTQVEYLQLGAHDFLLPIILRNVTPPGTPSDGVALYVTSGQAHALDANAVDINISLCPQPSATYAAPQSGGSASTEILDYAGGGALAGLDSTAATQLANLTSMMQALLTSFNSRLYPTIAP